MDAGQIDKMLYQHFVNYEYRLHNSFVYNWESDFFAMSKSNYFVEVEVKISRGDYFRDFGKEKHELFKAVFTKRSHVINRSPGRGDLICSYKYGKLMGISGISKKDLPDWYKAKHNGKRGFWVNDNTGAYIQRCREDVYAPCTRIHFHEVAKMKCPNQLYFACPTNLIKIEEIPPYAGLIYCGDEATIIKRAPYLHKVKQDMTAKLLQKFYHLWEYKTTTEKKLEITGQMEIFNQQKLFNNA